MRLLREIDLSIKKVTFQMYQKNIFIYTYFLQISSHNLYNLSSQCISIITRCSRWSLSTSIMQFFICSIHRNRSQLYSATMCLHCLQNLYLSIILRQSSHTFNPGKTLNFQRTQNICMDRLGWIITGCNSGPLLQGRVYGGGPFHFL